MMTSERTNVIPIYRLSDELGRSAIEALLARLRLDPADLALNRGERAAQAAVVQAILADVAARGDEAIVEVSRKFDSQIDSIR